MKNIPHLKKPFGEDQIYCHFHNYLTNKNPKELHLKEIVKNEKLIKEYIDKGADINFKNKYQENVLFEVFVVTKFLNILKYNVTIINLDR